MVPIVDSKTITLSDFVKSLEDKLDEHDCHLSPDDGCVCVEIRDTLTNIAKQIICLKQ